MFDAIRPQPHRGDLIAAGAVPLAVAVVTINVRFDGTWGHAQHLVLTAIACAVVLGMGLLAPAEGDTPRAYQTVLLLAGLALFAVALFRLAQVLGVDSPLSASGTVLWTSIVLAGVAAVPAWRLGSPICALVEFVAGGVAVLAFVDWAFAPKGQDTLRYVLLAIIAAYAVWHLRLREPRPRHAVHLVNAAGLAAILLAVSFVELNLFGGAGLRSNGPGTGWELMMAAAGFGLIAFGAVEHEPGPAYLGTVVLLLFVVLAGPASRDGASLIGWPALLFAVGAAAVIAGLRPSRPLPPEPGASGPPASPEPLRPAPAEAPTEVVDSGEAPTEPQPPGS